MGQSGEAHGRLPSCATLYATVTWEQTNGVVAMELANAPRGARAKPSRGSYDLLRLSLVGLQPARVAPNQIRR